MGFKLMKDHILELLWAVSITAMIDRGHGFESHASLNVFQALISQLLELCV